MELEEAASAFVAAQNAHDAAQEEAFGSKITAQEDYDLLGRKLADTDKAYGETWNALVRAAGGDVEAALRAATKAGKVPRDPRLGYSGQ